jgi:hypothetical protein
MFITLFLRLKHNTIIVDEHQLAVRVLKNIGNCCVPVMGGAGCPWSSGWRHRRWRRRGHRLRSTATQLSSLTAPIWPSVPTQLVRVCRREAAGWQPLPAVHPGALWTRLRDCGDFGGGCLVSMLAAARLTKAAFWRIAILAASFDSRVLVRKAAAERSGVLWKWRKHSLFGGRFAFSCRPKSETKPAQIRAGDKILAGRLKCEPWSSVFQPGSYFLGSEPIPGACWRCWLFSQHDTASDGDRGGSSRPVDLCGAEKEGISEPYRTYYSLLSSTKLTLKKKGSRVHKIWRPLVIS